jgi:tetratricopeptide (TPR) repeat protein
MNYKNIVLFILTISVTTILTSCAQTVTEKTITKTDYSYRLQEAIDIKKELIQGNYTKVEDLFLALSSDNISHTTDYLALNSGVEQLKKWSETTRKSEIAQLILATYYGHKGWKIRGYGYASDVPLKDRFSFSDYQKKALELYKDVQNNKLLKAEVYSRLIRVYMSLGETEKGTKAFQKCIKLDSLKVWAYIHQSEAIQPKWGGSLEEVTSLREKITSLELIDQITSLKLLLDSHISGDNLTGNDEVDLKTQSKELILKIDKQIRKNLPNSILKYILYNYMVAVAQEAENENIISTYFYKMNDNYTLYPFGIQ